MGHGEQGGCRLSIAAIKLSDPHAKEIVDGSDHVVVHTLNDEDNESGWGRKMESALYIYSRNIQPYRILMLLDYDFGKEKREALTNQAKITIDGNVMFYKDKQNRSFCIRFDSNDECHRIGQLVKQIISLSPQPIKNKENYAGILSMLAKAQEVFDSDAVTGEQAVRVTQSHKNYKTIPSANPNTVWSSPSVLDPVANLTSKGIKRTSSQSVCVNQIEKQQRKIAPQYSSLRLPVPTFKQNQSSLEVGTLRNFYSMFGINDQNVIATNQTKPKLLSPTMLSATNSMKDMGSSASLLLPKTIPSDMSVENRCEGNFKPEPLTHNQLMQAMRYLLKTDKDFMIKLHEAYLQSFKEMLLK